MKPLSEAERAAVAHKASLVKALMPELVPVIKELHEAGLIEGWRDVGYIGPHRPPREGERAVHVGQMVTESAAAMRERMKRGAY